MKLSIIIPVYNERNTIREILKRVSKVPLEKEILVVDDCSKDGTKEILLSLSADCAPIKILYHEKNKGKGQAIKTALKYITGDIVIIQDADLEYDPQDYPELIKPIISGRSDVVYGSRILGGFRGKYFRYYWGGRLVNFLTNFLYRVDITDESTCYKVFRSKVILGISLEASGFDFCVEITAKLCNLGHKIYEVPIHYYPRGFAEGKKIRWKDGFIAICSLLKYKFRK